MAAVSRLDRANLWAPPAARGLALVLPLMLALFLALGPAAAESTAPSVPPGEPQALEAAAQAERLLADAEFDAALEQIERAIAIWQPAADTPRPQGDARQRLARAYEIEAQCLFNLGRHAELRSSIERLLVLEPGYQLDRTTAGPRLIELLDARRKLLIGTIELHCSPLPCEQVEIDGEARVFAADGRYLVPAGDRRLRAGRRTFEPHAWEAVRVSAGEASRIEVQLVQRSRDLVLVTEPSGVTVSIDGRELGVTTAGAGGVAQRFVVPEVAPGEHVLRLSAPCRRRIEQSFDLFLDAQDPAPLDLGTLALPEARAALVLDPSRRLGELVIDGAPAVFGANDVCAGSRQVSWLAGGRRVWFETIEVREGDALTRALRPRPTLLLAGTGTLRGFPGDAWNVQAEPELPTELRPLEALLPRGTALPLHPQWLRGAAAQLAASIRASFPEADLIAVVIGGVDPIQPSSGVVLFDPRRGLWEATAWRDADQGRPAAVAAELDRDWPTSDRFFGFDLVTIDGLAPLIGEVLAGSPAEAAKLRPGSSLVSVDGRAVGTFAQELALTLAAGSDAGAQTSIKLETTLGAVRTVTELVPVRALHLPTQRELASQSLLPQLARCEVWRVAGDPHQSIAANVHAGLILAAVGEPEAAVLLLDRAAIDVAVDPAGDARATVAFTLEQLLRRLGRLDYAAEVRGRWTALPDARFGGRGGAALRHAALTPAAPPR